MSKQQDCKSTIERAFEIAGSGDVTTIERLKMMLAQEGYSLSVLTGPLMLKQLRRRIEIGQRPTTVTAH